MSSIHYRLFSLTEWKRRARHWKGEVFALYFSCLDSRTPWYAKAAALVVIGYALSPIDLIPDFIPVFGYLDDLLIVPLGIYLTIRLIPLPILREAREKARQEFGNTKSIELKKGWIGTILVLIIWAFCLLGLIILAVYLIKMVR